MAKSVFVSDLKDGVKSPSVDALFCIVKMELKTARSGNPFIKFLFQDRTGSLGGIYFKSKAGDVQEILDSFKMGQVVRVRGSYSSQYGLKIFPLAMNGLSLVKDYDVSDFRLTAGRSKEEMVLELTKILGSFKEPHLRQLADGLLAKQGLINGFAEQTGAKVIHHVGVGGLLEHTLEVVNICEIACKNHPELDRDVLVIGAVLHDIGKIWSYRIKGLSFEITDDEKMLSHSFVGAEVVDNIIKGVEGFPDSLRTHLIHLILSHSGKAEWGAAVEPRTPEAHVLHHADQISSKANQYIARK